LAWIIIFWSTRSSTKGRPLGFARLHAYDDDMKTASKPAITVDEFLAWPEGQERGRFELFDGEIVMQQSERITHVRVKGNIYSAEAGLKCTALPDGATVQIADDIAFVPDALVYCGETVSGLSLEVPNPVIVVEVLSASSATQGL
jgi:Uma2 family endonuclease